MTIHEEKYIWNGTLVNRSRTNYIILHHRGGNGDVQSIHSLHVNTNKWSGIGYHFYVRKNGEVYRGRPIDTIGAHCTGQNSDSIGICFEGDYSNTRDMPKKQLETGRELITYLKKMYSNAQVKRHKDFMATACPGKYFPFDEITFEAEKNQLLTSANDITWELNNSYFPISDVPRFVEALEIAKKTDSSLYWGYYKLVNRLK